MRSQLIILGIIIGSSALHMNCKARNATSKVRGFGFSDRDLDRSCLVYARDDNKVYFKTCRGTTCNRTKENENSGDQENLISTLADYEKKMREAYGVGPERKKLVVDTIARLDKEILENRSKIEKEQKEWDKYSPSIKDEGRKNKYMEEILTAKAAFGANIERLKMTRDEWTAYQIVIGDREKELEKIIDQVKNSDSYTPPAKYASDFSNVRSALYPVIGSKIEACFDPAVLPLITEHEALIQRWEVFKTQLAEWKVKRLQPLSSKPTREPGVGLTFKLANQSGRTLDVLFPETYRENGYDVFEKYVKGSFSKDRGGIDGLGCIPARLLLTRTTDFEMPRPDDNLAKKFALDLFDSFWAETPPINMKFCLYVSQPLAKMFPDLLDNGIVATPIYGRTRAKDDGYPSGEFQGIKFVQAWDGTSLYELKGQEPPAFESKNYLDSKIYKSYVDTFKDSLPQINGSVPAEPPPFQKFVEDRKNNSGSWSSNQNQTTPSNNNNSNPNNGGSTPQNQQGGSNNQNQTMPPTNSVNTNNGGSMPPNQQGLSADEAEVLRLMKAVGLDGNMRVDEATRDSCLGATKAAKAGPPWSPLMAHFYCQFPIQDQQQKYSIRGCFTGRIRNQAPFDQPPIKQGVSPGRQEAFEYCSTSNNGGPRPEFEWLKNQSKGLEIFGDVMAHDKFKDSKAQDRIIHAFYAPKPIPVY